MDKLPQQTAIAPVMTHDDRRSGPKAELTLQERIAMRHSMALGDIRDVFDTFNDPDKLKSLRVEELAALQEKIKAYVDVAELMIKTQRGMLSVDYLTNIHNRDGLGDKLSEQISAVTLKQNSPEYNKTDFYLCLVIDLDKFKSLNDTLGHAAGDMALVEFAIILKELVRESDLSLRVKAGSVTDNLSGGDTSIGARTGGDEFVVVLPMNVSKDASGDDIEIKVGIFLNKFKSKLLEGLSRKVFKQIETVENGVSIKKVICEDRQLGEKLAEGEFVIGATVGSAYCKHQNDINMRDEIFKTLDAADKAMLANKQSGRR